MEVDMKHIILAFILLAVFALPARAQEKAKIDPADYQETVDTPPEIIGGMKALAKNIVYPEAAKESGIQGMVLLKVLIGTDGNPDDVSVEKSESELLNESAMNAVRAVRFKPGKIGGEAVKTQVMIPVKYKLDGGGKN
jgi:TonB family protein